jgi:hypothetical protein
MAVRAPGPAAGRGRALSGIDPRTCGRRVNENLPGETRPRRCGLGQIWVIFRGKTEFAIGRIRSFSADCAKRPEIGPMPRPKSPGKLLWNWPETGRKRAYFKLLSAGPGFGPG